jgi:uncharacterized protein YdhG (YjbR/CyaY superfamily)
MKQYKDVDEYIILADESKRDILAKVRSIIKSVAPEATESIAYGMPAYTWSPSTKQKESPLFYFAAMKGHLGLYPTPGPIVTFKELLKDYSTSKGCVRVPYGVNLPKTLIVKLLKERVKEIKGK